MSLGGNGAGRVVIRRVAVTSNTRLNITIALLLTLLAGAWKLGTSFGAWQADWEQWREATDRRIALVEKSVSEARDALKVYQAYPAASPSK